MGIVKLSLGGINKNSAKFNGKADKNFLKSVKPAHLSSKSAPSNDTFKSLADMTLTNSFTFNRTVSRLFSHLKLK